MTPHWPAAFSEGFMTQRAAMDLLARSRHTSSYPAHHYCCGRDGGASGWRPFQRQQAKDPGGRVLSDLGRPLEELQ